MERTLNIALEGETVQEPVKSSSYIYLRNDALPTPSFCGHMVSFKLQICTTDVTFWLLNVVVAVLAKAWNHKDP